MPTGSTKFFRLVRSFGCHKIRLLSSRTKIRSFQENVKPPHLFSTAPKAQRITFLCVNTIQSLFKISPQAFKNNNFSCLSPEIPSFWLQILKISSEYLDIPPQFSEFSLKMMEFHVRHEILNRLSGKKIPSAKAVRRLVHRICTTPLVRLCAS